MEDWIQVAFNYGLPAVICFVLLFRFDKTMNKMEESINALTQVIIKMEMKHK